MQKNLEAILGELQALKIALPRIIGVSKRQSAETVRTLYQSGIRDFGENYLQEAQGKMESLGDLEIQWHFIGQLQRKKLKDIVGKFTWIHSLDRMEVATKISEIAVDKGLRQKILVQVNIANEASKGGVLPEDTKDFLHETRNLPGLEVRGLMIFPPPPQEGVGERDWYDLGHQLFQSMKVLEGKAFTELSMGTSSDYLRAAKAGSTMLRLGEVLMGPRQ